MLPLLMIQLNLKKLPMVGMPYGRMMMMIIKQRPMKITKPLTQKSVPKIPANKLPLSGERSCIIGQSLLSCYKIALMQKKDR